MTTKKSLVEVTHDDGYGDSLLMHINSAFGGKDMRADKIVDPVAPAMQIEGMPDGWEFVRIGPVRYGEWRLMESGAVKQWDVMEPSLGWAVVLRKIEKPKKYRPFANAAEFEPHREKWLKHKNGNGDHRIKTHSYNDRKHYTGDVGDTWKAMFDSYEFEDGTPFGVEVAE